MNEKLASAITGQCVFEVKKKPKVLLCCGFYLYHLTALSVTHKK